MNWYVIFVENGYEEEVCLFINKVKPYLFKDIKYNLFIPKRKIYERKKGIKQVVIRRIFPGYILVETETIYEFYNRVKGSPHILKFLKDNYDFLQVKINEISLLLQMTNKEGIIEISQAFNLNDKIMITKGPLSGKDGIIKKIDIRKGRAKVKFSINNNVFYIDLGIDVMRKLAV